MAKWEAVKKEESEEEKKAYFDENQEENPGEVIEKADEGEMLVFFRRVLSGQKGVKDGQRENIFHSRCSV